MQTTTSNPAEPLTGTKADDFATMFVLGQLRAYYGPDTVHPAAKIARLAFLTPRATRRSLDRLAASGVASRHDNGRTFRWRLSDRAARGGCS